MPGSERLIRAEFTRPVIGIFYDVYNELGFGFSEKIYHRAMVLALRGAGMRVASEVTLPVWFRDQVIGRFRADIIIDETMIVELKTLPMIYSSNVAQLLNYLKSTRREFGLLLNFGREPQFKRLILTSDHRKKYQPGRPPVPETIRVNPRASV